MSDTTDGQVSKADSVAAPRLLPPAWLWIVGAGVIAHGLVPLTDYVIWDGWWYAADLAAPDGPATMKRLFHEVGRPMDMWFCAPLRWIGRSPVGWAKWLGTATWICTAVCIGAVLRRIALLPAATCSAIGVLVATLPIFDLLGELALWMNTACVLLFWMAWLAVAELRCSKGLVAIGTRLASLSMFFVSFNLNSNLVMFYAVAAALAGLRLHKCRIAMLRSVLPGVLARHADFLALPVLFWSWKTWFTPANGFYATGYNQPSLAVDRLAAGYLGLFSDFGLRGVADFLAASSWLLPAAVMAVVTVIFWNRFSQGPAPERGDANLGPRFLGWGIFLLLAAAFPYIAVGQRLACEGWLTRNCILCPLPVALIATGSLLLLNRWLLPRQGWAWLSGVAALATLGVGGCINNYLSYQALGAKQWSLRQTLSEAAQESKAAVVQLRDYAHIPKTISYYPPIIWTYIATPAGRSPTTFVVETATLGPDTVRQGADGSLQRVVPVLPLQAADVNQMITDTTMPYALENIPRVGPHLLIVANAGYPGVRAADLGKRYLYLRWFEPRRLDEFVRGFTKSEISVLPAIK